MDLLRFFLEGDVDVLLFDDMYTYPVTARTVPKPIATKSLVAGASMIGCWFVKSFGCCVVGVGVV